MPGMEGGRGREGGGREGGGRDGCRGRGEGWGWGGLRGSEAGVSATAQGGWAREEGGGKEGRAESGLLPVCRAVAAAEACRKSESRQK